MDLPIWLSNSDQGFGVTTDSRRNAFLTGNVYNFTNPMTIHTDVF